MELFQGNQFLQLNIFIFSINFLILKLFSLFLNFIYKTINYIKPLQNQNSIRKNNLLPKTKQESIFLRKLKKMPSRWLKRYFGPFLNSRSMQFMIKIYIECLAYLFPVLMVYMLSSNLKKTLFTLTIIILIRFLVAFYQIGKSQQQPLKVLKYASCHHGYYMDSVQKSKLQKQCQLKYEEFKKKQSQMTAKQKSTKENQIQSVVRQLREKERVVMNKWE